MMALAGTGAICIWNDITPEGRDEFYDWHINEHMPERSAVPGFLRSRRYIAIDRETHPEFFTLYETRDVAVLTGPDYLARLNNPTPWTKTATQAFRNTSRALTRVEASVGPGAGGMLATLRIAIIAEREADALQRLGETVLPALIAQARVTGAHLCLTNRDASAARTTESRNRTDILAAPETVVLIEGCDVEALRQAVVTLSAAIGAMLERPAEVGFYRLEYQC
jgi:hypothetical protein